MLKLDLKHHVYTSIEGYQTVFASRGLPSEILRRVEESARQLYPRLYGQFSRSLYYCDSYLCHSKVFRYGHDHVGRPRTCVHSILIDLTWQDASLDPFALSADHFLSPDVPDEDLSYELREQAFWPTSREVLPERVRWLLESGIEPLRFAELLTLIPGVLAGEVPGPGLLRSPTDDAFHFAGNVAAFLPPALRNQVMATSGIALPGALVALGPPNASPAEFAAAWAIDCHAPSNGQVGLSDFAVLISEYLFHRRDLQTLALILDFLATYEDGPRSASLALNRFSRAFRAIQRFVSRGNGHLEVDEHSLEAFFGAATELGVSGFQRLSASVFDACFERLGRTKDLGKIALGISVLRKTLEGEVSSLAPGERDILKQMLLQRLGELVSPDRPVMIRGPEDLTHKFNINSDVTALLSLLTARGRPRSEDASHV